MGIIAFIILGLLAGLIAKAIMPGSDPGGYIVTAVIGIVGALLGGFLAGVLFDAHPLDEFFDIFGAWLVALLLHAPIKRDAPAAISASLLANLAEFREKTPQRGADRATRACGSAGYASVAHGVRGPRFSFEPR